MVNISRVYFGQPIVIILHIYRRTSKRPHLIHDSYHPYAFIYDVFTNTLLISISIVRPKRRGARNERPGAEESGSNSIYVLSQ